MPLSRFRLVGSSLYELGSTDAGGLRRSLRPGGELDDVRIRQLEADRSRARAVSLAVTLCSYLTATAGASSRRSQGVPGWGDPGGCYYGANCEVLGLLAPGRPGTDELPGRRHRLRPRAHVGPFGLQRASAATEIANIAVGEGYQWAGGCYDNDDRDPTGQRVSARDEVDARRGAGLLRARLARLARVQSGLNPATTRSTSGSARPTTTARTTRPGSSTRPAALARPT